MARDTLGMEFEVHDHILRSTPLEVQMCPLYNAYYAEHNHRCEEKWVKGRRRNICYSLQMKFITKSCLHNNKFKMMTIQIASLVRNS